MSCSIGSVARRRISRAEESPSLEKVNEFFLVNFVIDGLLVGEKAFDPKFFRIIEMERPDQKDIMNASKKQLLTHLYKKLTAAPFSYLGS